MGTEYAIKSMTSREFALLGLQEIAYVKSVFEDGEMSYTIYSADGKPVGSAPSIELACAVIVQHDLEPVLVH